MKRITAVILGVLLVLASAFQFAGCGSEKETDGSTIEGDLMYGIAPSDVQTVELNSGCTVDVTDFCVRLFRECYEGENTVISPVSVIYALAMTANGAEGETLKQMEDTIGVSSEELNLYLHTYMTLLPANELCRLSAANSIWLKNDDRISVSQDFLQKNADYYGAGVFQRDFDDDTLKAINSWVSRNTDGMVKEILDSISPETVMYLINAVSFDAEWESVYFDYQVFEDNFFDADGREQTVEFLHSIEQTYICGDCSQGFVKYYSGGSFAFAAILPDEGIDINDFVAGLSGEELHRMLSEAADNEVITAIPKFENEFSAELSDVLKNMGITDAFNGDFADFSGMGTYEDGNIFVNRILHKAHIAVDERGTKAGAATAVEMNLITSAGPEEEKPEPKVVLLNRPFVYLIIDCNAGLPVFMGTVMSVE